MSRKWGSRRDRKWTAAVLARYGRVCALRLEGCTGVATTGDHIKPRSTHPWLEHDVSNGRPACLSCNRLRGARPLPLVSIDATTEFFESADTSRRESLLSLPPVLRKNAGTGGGASDA